MKKFEWRKIMKKTFTYSMIILLLLPLISLNCNREKYGDDPVEEPIIIPEGDVEVAAYYFPNWGPVYSSEWSLIKAAKPQFEGHQQPKVPMWGYTNENDPQVMAKKIDAAADYGINAFIFDWYWYDDGSELLAGRQDHWDGNKYLYMALEKGFLNASNNNKLKFALMWCNHNLEPYVKGAVQPETFESLIDYVIEKYFKHPSYWKIDGCPYFSIYQFNTLLETYGNDFTLLESAINKFRKKVKAAGFPDLHLNAVLWGLKGELLSDEVIDRLKINSTTSYVWIHHNTLPDFPTTEYEKVAETYFRTLKFGGGANGLEKPINTISTPYHINVIMGWDSSPRCGNSPDWMTRRDYPFGPVIINNTPYLFKKYLAKAKELTMQKPEEERIITINSWNEWGEGSYLEPDMINGMEYLDAVKNVFK